MAKGDFKCNSCGRTFSMAAHLARHKSTMHKRRGRPRGLKNMTKAGGSGRSMFGTMGFGGDLADDGSRVLSEMQAYRNTLLMQRSQIDQRLEGLQNALSVLGSSEYGKFVPGGSVRASTTHGKRRGRPPGPKNRNRSNTYASVVRTGKRGRPGSLRQVIVKVLRQRSQPQSPQEITVAVRKAGYKTKSEHLTKSISNTLPQLAEVRKVGRGLYQIA